MQMGDKSNIIQFRSKFQSDKFDLDDDAQENGQLFAFAKKKLFKNASLVDILKNDFSVVDILIEDGKISGIYESGKISESPDMEVRDLEGDFVLPSFCNHYARSDQLIGAVLPKDKANLKFYELFYEALRMSDFLSGNVNTVDVSSNNVRLLEDILSYDEKELENLSDEIAKKNQTVFLHVGLTLEELGSVEKKFGKPLVQVLEDFGFLDRHWVLVGGNCLEKDDFQILSQYDGLVVLCPLEDAHIGRRTLNIQMLKNLGLEIRLGSGGAIETDMFEATRQLLSTQRALFENKDALTESEALMFATDGKGTLKVGAEANFIVLLNEPTLRDNLMEQLVWESSRHGPLMTVADGDILQFEGYIFNNNLKMDYFDVLEKLNEMKEKTKK